MMELSDTDPRAKEVWIELLRKMGPEGRLAMALRITDLAFRMSEAGVRQAHPHASDREVFLRAASWRLPRETMIRAYGWDPESGIVPD
jgi:hypothetical protein